jgi:hypothetical protein
VEAHGREEEVMRVVGVPQYGGMVWVDLDQIQAIGPALHGGADTIFEVNVYLKHRQEPLVLYRSYDPIPEPTVEQLLESERMSVEGRRAGHSRLAAARRVKLSALRDEVQQQLADQLARAWATPKITGAGITLEEYLA